MHIKVGLKIANLMNLCHLKVTYAECHLKANKGDSTRIGQAPFESRIWISHLPSKACQKQFLHSKEANVDIVIAFVSISATRECH